MNAQEDRVRSLIAEQAAGWVITNRENPDERERRAFAAWLRESPVHIEEYLALAAISRDLREACADSAVRLEDVLLRARSEEHPTIEPLRPRTAAGALRGLSAPRLQATLRIAAALAIVSVGALVLLRFNPVVRAPLVEDATVLRIQALPGERRTMRLADNSVLHLNGGSAVTVRISRTERLVTVERGEVNFDVIHDPDRRLRVLAGPAEIVDVGTRFDVRLEDASTLITVAEGQIEVSRTSPGNGGAVSQHRGGPTDFIRLTADQQLQVSRDSWPATPTAVDAHAAAAWSRRNLAFENQPLEQVANELNRYTARRIEIVAPELQTLHISGSFATDDPEAFVSFLRSLDAVRVEETPARVLVSKK